MGKRGNEVMGPLRGSSSKKEFEKIFFYPSCDPGRDRGRPSEKNHFSEVFPKDPTGGGLLENGPLQGSPF